MIEEIIKAEAEKRHADDPQAGRQLRNLNTVYRNMFIESATWGYNLAITALTTPKEKKSRRDIEENEQDCIGLRQLLIDIEYGEVDVLDIPEWLADVFGSNGCTSSDYVSGQDFVAVINFLNSRGYETGINHYPSDVEVGEVEDKREITRGKLQNLLNRITDEELVLYYDEWTKRQVSTTPVTSIDWEAIEKAVFSKAIDTNMSLYRGETNRLVAVVKEYLRQHIGTGEVKKPEPEREYKKHGDCTECDKKNVGLIDYNGHGYWTCENCNRCLNNQFDEEYR